MRLCPGQEAGEEVHSRLPHSTVPTEGPLISTSGQESPVSGLLYPLTPRLSPFSIPTRGLEKELDAREAVEAV